MAHTNLSVRIDEQDKRLFEEFCDRTGMNVSVAVNMFIKTVLREQQLPFIVKADPFYSRENIAELERRVTDLQSGKSTLKSHELIEVE